MNMIRFQRSLRAARGRNAEAIQWAKEVSDYVNSKHPNHKVQAFSSRFGDIGVLFWQVDFEDLAALDKFQQTLGVDQDYWDLVNKATAFFEGAVHDIVFETL
jgi:hypothetical protein